MFDKTQPPPELARALNYQAWGVGDIMNLPAGWLLRMNIVLNYYRAFTGYLNAAASNQSVEFTRKHTANVRDALGEIRSIIETLTRKRDERRDAFAKVILKAMDTRLGNDAEEVAKVLAQKTIPRSLAKQALAIAQEQGRFTIFALVDALTRLCREMENAGDRTEADQKVSKLLELVA